MPYVNQTLTNAYVLDSGLILGAGPITMFELRIKPKWDESLTRQ